MRRWLLPFFLSLSSACARPPQAKAPSTPQGRFGKATSGPEVKSWMKLPTEGDAQVLAVEAGVAGDRVSALLEVPESDCAILIARGTRSVDDVDLFAYGEDGAVLGSDEASDKAPALLVCPPHPRRIYVSARVAAGHGMVAIITHGTFRRLGGVFLSMSNAKTTSESEAIKPIRLKTNARRRNAMSFIYCPSPSPVAPARARDPRQTRHSR